MTLKIILILAITGLSLEGLALGDKAGNGGGGVCVNGLCKTLAEAGIQIQRPTEKPLWQIPLALVTELQDIASTLPFGGADIVKAALAETNTFEVVDRIDARTMRDALSEYKRVIKENNFETNGELQIFAFSDSDTKKTYLLPGFFKLLARQQALILIHEANIRVNPNLARALEFDLLLLKNLSDPSGKSFDYLRFIGSLGSTLQRLSQVWYEGEIFLAVIKYFEQQSGRQLVLSDFRDTPFFNSTMPNQFVGMQAPITGGLAFIGRMSILRSAQNFGPTFYKAFANAEMVTTGVYIADRSSGQAIWTPHAFRSNAGLRCQGKEKLNGLDAYVLVPTFFNDGSKGVMAADCSARQPDGTYLAAFAVVRYIRLGNLY